MTPKRVLVLGATGSIGRQALDVALAEPERFEVVGLQAHGSIPALEAAAAQFPQALLALTGPKAPEELAGRRPIVGPEALLRLIRESKADIAVNGIAGAAGLKPSVDCLENGMDLALANKESVVMAWPLLVEAAATGRRRILPVDSEHAALFQLVERIKDFEELVITASGGAFRDWPLARLREARPDEAAAHPSWAMGRKISIDSATMANKGLEVIEAARLFGVEGARIKVLIHPQSVVHALVRGRDGSVYANLSEPDMRLPIRNALTYPETSASPFGRLELEGRSLDFRKAERERYPLLYLAREALSDGYGATVAYNAANEEAVQAFDASRIGFLDIEAIVARVLDMTHDKVLPDLEAVSAADRRAREAARAAIKEIE